MTQIEFCDSNVITQYGGCLWSEQAAMNSIDSLAARGGSFVTINDGFLFWLMPQAGAARQEFADLFDPETGYMPTHYPNMKLIVKGSMSTEEIAGYCADLTATTRTQPAIRLGHRSTSWGVSRPSNSIPRQELAEGWIVVHGWCGMTHSTA